MIKFLKNNGQRNVLLFVHGLKGSIDSWANFEESKFHELLIKNDIIDDNYDIAYFEYYTKFLNITGSAKNTLNRLKGLFKSTKSDPNKKNVSITEISETLYTDTRFQLSDYENVIIIAHSMGGIIAKGYILNEIARDHSTKVRMIHSLAVPHLGSNLANFGNLFSSNIQVDDLKPLSDSTSALNSAWLKSEDTPPIKYYYGTYDQIVPKNSAISIEALDQDIIACEHDHTTICKPKDETDTVIKAISHFLVQFVQEYKSQKALKIQKLENEWQFEDEYFVLKLLIADIHNSTISNAKELFLNAECAKKLYTSDSNLEKLTELYSRIRDIYKEVYDIYISEGLSSAQLVSKVHEYISNQDSDYLKSNLPKLTRVHKKGMIHQLANELSDDIWWKEKKDSETLNIEELKSKKRKLDGSA